MQLDPQDFLRLVEKAKTFVTFDIEATGFTGDYNTTLVTSFKWWGEKKCRSFKVKQVGNDQKVIREAKEELEKADCWLSYYGKGYDIKFLNTRLLKWGMAPIEKRPHIDMYYTLKSNTALSRRSMAHISKWLGAKNLKMDVSADDWAVAAANWDKVHHTMVKRCEADCLELEELYEKCKHLVKDIKR